jgi:hypothetical protein
LQEAVGVPASKSETGESTGLFAAIDEANKNIATVTSTATTVND